MFHRTHDELKQLGAATTTSEIMQQPELWRDTFLIHRNQLDDIETFLSDADLWQTDVLSSFSPERGPRTMSETHARLTLGMQETRHAMSSNPLLLPISYPLRSTSLILMTQLFSFLLHALATARVSCRN